MEVLPGNECTAGSAFLQSASTKAPQAISRAEKAKHILGSFLSSGADGGEPTAGGVRLPLAGTFVDRRIWSRVEKNSGRVIRIGAKHLSCSGALLVYRKRCQVEPKRPDV